MNNLEMEYELKKILNRDLSQLSADQTLENQL